MSTRSVIICSFVVLCLTTIGFARQAPHKPRDVKAVYAEVCASCHGPDMKGAGAAPSLLDDTWDVLGVYFLISAS